jgi:hypothetical protein
MTPHPTTPHNLPADTESFWSSIYERRGVFLLSLMVVICMIAWGFLFL